MPEEKGLGSKLLGLFVEVKPDAPGEEVPAGNSENKSAAELVAELAKESGARKSPLAPTARPMHQPTGPVTPAQVDFETVFKSAGMDSADLDRVKKAEELLKSLPESTPLDLKRQIVEVSLKAFGFDTARIIAAANNQLKALETYVRLNEQQTAKAINDTQTQVASLEDKVISLKADINKRIDQLAAVAAAADGRKGQVQRVLEFFNSPAAPPPTAGATPSGKP